MIRLTIHIDGSNGLSIKSKATGEHVTDEEMLANQMIREALEAVIIFMAKASGNDLTIVQGEESDEIITALQAAAQKRIPNL